MVIVIAIRLGLEAALPYKEKIPITLGGGGGGGGEYSMCKS